MSTSQLGYNRPQLQSYEDTMRFLTWEQFPVILEKSIEYFAALPTLGTYQHFLPGVLPFGEALLMTSGRQFTLSGVGSLIDTDRYGHTIKRPTPQLSGTGCNANSLCLDPTCFGFSEGVIESSNKLQNICWSLSMPCLKDHFYSDRMFDQKMQKYFAMFFQQPLAVTQAYQRTELIRSAIKIVATAQNFTYTGTNVIGGGISLPFYIDPNDPMAFPDISAINGGVGGLNMKAFDQFLRSRLFSGTFAGGVEKIRCYGLRSDYEVAKAQTESVLDQPIGLALSLALSQRGVNQGLDGLLGDFIEDPLFPTFQSVGGVLEPVPYEILEPSTIAGYVQTGNPAHGLQKYRGLLLVPDNWNYQLVEPPKDDFSDLGLGGGLNFRTNSPGVFPVLSSSMFTRNQLGRDGVVQLGMVQGPGGMLVPSVRGLVQRPQAIQEAIRTEVLMTYANMTCAPEGQLPHVGPSTFPQGRADGFNLKSTLYLGTKVRGTARPVLLLFQTDVPRSARPIEVCTTNTVTVDTDPAYSVQKCCPGNQIYATITFNGDVSDLYSEGDDAVWRTGANASSYTVEVTAVSGSVVTIQSSDGTTLLPCCTGSPDDYGTRGQLINVSTADATSSEVLKFQYDSVTGVLFLELFDALAATSDEDPVTLTLADGTEILLQTVGAGAGVFLEVELAAGETYDLADLDCACMVGAILAVTGS